MKNRIAACVALGLIASSALGLQGFAATSAVRETRSWIAGGSAYALIAATRIASTTVAAAARSRAEDAAFVATLGVVRGLGSVYGAIQRPGAVSATLPATPRVDVEECVLHGVQNGVKVRVAIIS